MGEGYKPEKHELRIVKWGAQAYESSRQQVLEMSCCQRAHTED